MNIKKDWRHCVSKKILIIGEGSGGKNHFKALRLIEKKIVIKLIPSRKFIKIPKKNYANLINYDPDYIIICSPSSFHYKFILLIEKLYNNKIVLVEKPLFNKKQDISKIKKNKYFVGYNLRHHPVLKFIKDYVRKKNIFFVRSDCFTYLPDWRNIDYKKTVSAQKKLGGGVLLELSHEIDYLNWIFGNLKILYSFNKKVSNLKIDCDDILCLNATNKKNIFINLNLNFFSKIEKREIIINGKNFSIYGDIKNNTITLIEGEKKKIFKYKNYNIMQSYKKESLNLLNKNYSTNCTFKEAMIVQKLIEEIKISI